MIYNGVDTEFRDPNKVEKSERLARRAVHGLEDRFVVLYYGHAGKSKGLEYLIEAMPSAYTQNPKLLFVYNFIASKSTEPMKTKIR
jgi:glycosyltransferase involved in cell wall biosynthesis